MIKRLKMKCKYFLFSFFLLLFQPFFILSNTLILLFGTTKIPLSFSFPVFFSKKQHLSLTYASLTSTIYEENMLTDQASLKESICEEMFPITYIKIGVAPRQLISCQQCLIFVSCKKCVLNFTDTFNSWFCNLLL